MTTITVNLPPETYRRVERLAHLMRREIADVVVETVQLALPPLFFQAMVPPPPTASLSDAEILALVNLQLEPEQDQQLTILLDKQQAGILTDMERLALLALMQIYQENLLRKAQALREAVRRGLHSPLDEA
jgi:hypothetical protein